MTLATDILSTRDVTTHDATCAHCNQPVPRGIIDTGSALQFCCAGCRAVFQTIHACGLDEYYRLRDSSDAVTRPAKLLESQFRAFDTETFAKLYVNRDESHAHHCDLLLEGVNCAACVWLVERLPRVIDGVIDARLSLRESTVRITWDPARTSLSQVAIALSRLGYTPHPARGVSRREVFRREERTRLIHIAAAGAIMGNVMMLALALYAGMFQGIEREFETLFRYISAGLGTISLAWPGRVFFVSAFRAIRARTANLDVPIVLALCAGGVAGVVNVVLGRGEIYFDTLTVLVFLLLVGRFIQFRQQRKADDAVELLYSLTPSTCLIERDGTLDEYPIEALRVDDVVEVRPGCLIPADGVVETGQSTVNQSLLSGESKPVGVSAGSIVYGASQNEGGVLRVRVTQVGGDSRVGRLMRLVEQSILEKPEIVQFADRVGFWFTPAVLLAGLATFLYWARISLPLAVDHSIALLIVACPCVLGLATPMTIAIAIGKLARSSILVKSGVALERLSRGGNLLLDKTGTLTYGQMKLVEWVGDETLRNLGGALESKSVHPIAAAIATGIDSADYDIANVNETRGAIQGRVNGVQVEISSPAYFSSRQTAIPPSFERRRAEFERRGYTCVLVARDGNVAAMAVIGDVIRDDAAKSIEALRTFGFEPAIVSGDSQAVVDHVARQLGITSARGGVSPEQKVECARASANGRQTVMIGDGVNDAAALARAGVGIAVHGGAEASLASSDVYIAKPGLTGVVELTQMAARTMSVVRRNLLVSLSYNVLAGTLAAIGWMNPMIAAIIMPMSSATVLSIAVSSIKKVRKS